MWSWGRTTNHKMIVMYCCKVTRSFDFDEKKEIERERVRVRLSERDIEQT